MKKISLFICISCLFLCETKAQDIPNAFTLVRKEIDSLRFYDALIKLRTNAASYQDDRNSQGLYFQALATVYAFNGMPDSAITTHDRARTQGILKTGSRPADTTHFENYFAVPAQSYRFNTGI
ncbi:MAG: hypothetical protein LBM08_15195 [Dysgonamonadaceae bacterium]|jgi:hypothetical protein|nr:hypothetical protein [Dysgonamonadaceae bacterium]